MKLPKTLKSIRYTSKLSLFGIPLLAVASGPSLARDEPFGHVRSILAVGDVATGVVALGGVARGLFARGGVNIGVVASGGVAVGGLASGRVALGAIAIGALAIGVIAVGGLAIGLTKAVGAQAILLGLSGDSRNAYSDAGANGLGGATLILQAKRTRRRGRR